MPILVRPVREQLEHDRIIRLLQAKWRRKYKVEINPGEERNAPVKVGENAIYPDLVLTADGGRKPHAVVEVETGESVNHLEAMSQWATLGRSRINFYLIVPVGSVDSARRLCADYQIPLAELWSFLPLGDQVRFSTVYRSPSAEVDEGEDQRPAEAPPKRAAAPAARRPPARRPAAPVARRKPATAAKRTSAKRPARGAAKRVTVRGVKRTSAKRTATKSSRAQKRK